jgi:hypothetical protein
MVRTCSQYNRMLKICKLGTGSIPGRVFQWYRCFLLSISSQRRLRHIQVQLVAKTRLVVEGPHLQSIKWYSVHVQAAHQFDSGTSHVPIFQPFFFGGGRGCAGSSTACNRHSKYLFFNNFVTRSRALLIYSATHYIKNKIHGRWSAPALNK